MYTLDSGWVSIIATILAIGIGIYGSIDSKKKKEQARRDSAHATSDEVDLDFYDDNEDDGEVIEEGRKRDDDKIFSNPFDELLGFLEEREVEKRRHDVAVNEVENQTVKEFECQKFNEKAKEVIVIPQPSVAAKVTNEVDYYNGMDSIENSGNIERETSEDFIVTQDTVIEDGAIGDVNDIKTHTSAGKEAIKRLKLNPKDLILFSEILKPKYQDI